MVGNAFAFVDPVFSSGDYLAISSACLGAEVVGSHLRRLENAPQIAEAYERKVNRGLRTFSWFIYRFISPPIHRLFMEPKNTFHMQEAVISVLAGDLFRNTPLALPLTLFKALYYSMSTLHFASSWRGYLHRRRNAKPNFTGGVTAHDEISRPT
jgi:hypothetical protein